MPVEVLCHAFLNEVKISEDETKEAWLARILLRIFASIFIREIGLKFSMDKFPGTKVKSRSG